jgi:transposase
MPPARVSDEVWQEIQPLIPPAAQRHRTLSDRDALDAMVLVLTEGGGWLQLDRATSGAHGSTVWRRIRQWQDLGRWDDIASVIIASRDDLDEPAKARLRDGRRKLHRTG